MIDKALVGDKRYWAWMAALVVLIGIGACCYLWQLCEGLGITGLGRDVSWGLYIAQFTFFVGVAASAVMVVLPYYLHNYKAFGKITILGEFLAVAAVVVCGLFILVDMGRPDRVAYMMLHLSPRSPLFWDMVSLNGYLVINLAIAWVTLTARRKGDPAPKWLTPLIYLSIPWAVSIHTVTAFIYAGLPGRHMWLTGLMAVRFLGSAFAAGPALLIILCLIMKRLTRFDAGEDAIQNLARIVTYALVASIFFVVLEFFTAFYSQVPGHTHGLEYLYFHGGLAALMRIAAVLGVASAVILLIPRLRRNETVLFWTCAATFVALWIEKGIGLVIGGFNPSPLNKPAPYCPTAPELFITIGIWAIGLLMVTALYKIAIGVERELTA